MKSRTVHLVGSLPAQDTSDALSWAVEMLGDTLGPCVPDGETGNRSDWVNRLVEALRYHADRELVRDGTW
jgi:hypothetical protein